MTIAKSHPYKYKVCRDCGWGVRAPRDASISNCSNCGGSRLIDYVSNVNREVLTIDMETLNSQMLLLEANREKIDAWHAEKRAAKERARRAAERVEAEAARRREAARRQHEAALAAERARQQREREEVARIAQQRADFMEALSEDYWSGLSTSPEPVPDELRDRWATEFVQAWSRSHRSEITLDEDQALAVGARDRHALVVARAGSGKTRTLVQRAVFLVEQCGIAASSIMLLAFNRAAADEMEDRLRRALGPDEVLPHVMTFHALAYALVQPTEEIVFDDIDRLGGSANSRLVNLIVDGLLTEPRFAHEIHALVRLMFRTDWVKIEQGTAGMTPEDYLAWSRGQPLVTLGNETVRSFGEQAIANILFEHGVPYHYERASLRRIGENRSAYRPDFTILPYGGMQRRVIIEYFGMVGDTDYDRQIEGKKAFWREQEADHAFIDLYPRDLMGGTLQFTEFLVERLRALGVPAQRLSEDEVWRRTKELTQYRITGALKGFILNARQRAWTVEIARSEVAAHYVEEDSERAFLQVALVAYDRYVQALAANNEIDFPELLERATRRLSEGRSGFVRAAGTEQGDVANLRFLLIDEYQDFSPSFQRLVDAVGELAPSMKQFAVGDDWQAINRFAGATTELFDGFVDRVPDSLQLTISTNYRSARDIISAGNAVMDGRGRPAIAATSMSGRVVIYAADTLTPLPSERSGALEDLSLDDVARLRLIRHALRTAADGETIMLLVRTNGERKGVETDLRRALTAAEFERLDVRTTHRSKGLEADLVLMLGVRASTYPLVNPLWKLYRVFGESKELIETDDLRLFYVGITRARRETWILSSGEEESPFLVPIRQRLPNTAGDWALVPPIAAPDHLQIWIEAPYSVDTNKELKAARFRWNPESKTWVKAVESNDASAQLRALRPVRGMIARFQTADGSVVAERGFDNWTNPVNVRS